MENIYHIREDNPNLLVDEIGIIEDGYDPWGRDGSLLMDLNDSIEKKRIEHRDHKRFQLNKNAFALIRPITTGALKIKGKSMGCIACAVFNAKPAKLGKIENISMGGLMFQYADSNTNISKELVLDILLADCRFYLANMHFKILSDFVLPADIPGTHFEMHQVRLQFQKLSDYQQVRLNDFIINHGTQIGEIGF